MSDFEIWYDDQIGNDVPAMLVDLFRGVDYRKLKKINPDHSIDAISGIALPEYNV